MGPMRTAGELKAAADEALFSDSFEDALRLYVQLLTVQPLNLDARLRIADALLALGEVQRAAIVYTKLAQYAAHAGYPLRALTALKVLAALEPELRGLLRAVSELYGRDSARLGRGVRRSLPDAAEPVPRGSLPPQASRAELTVEAERLAADYAHKDALLPDKLMPIPLLSTLDQDELSRVFDACELVRARAGTCLVEQGSPGASLFLLARGSVRVTRVDAGGRSRHLGVLHEGAMFGELSFLSGGGRSASVVALSDCDLLELEASALAHTGAPGEKLQQAVAAFARERLLAHVMANSPLFAPLEVTQRLDLVQRFVELEVGPGTEIVRQGEPSQGAYVLLRGQVAVRRTEDGRDAELARLGPGDLFGEMSLLSGVGATATVRAIEATSLLVLHKSYVERLLEALPEVRAELERLSASRAQQIRASFPGTVRGDEPSIEIEVLL
jgi:cAMP-dependent protein kinase regulator